MIDFLTQISVMQKKNKQTARLTSTQVHWFYEFPQTISPSTSELKTKCSIKMRWAPEGIYLNVAEIRLGAEL